MQFLKKNYEKILLGLALVGLVAAVGTMPFLVSQEKQSLEDLRNSYINRKVKPLPAPEVERFEVVVKQAGAPIKIDLSSTNRLFNPVRWLRPPNGQPFPISPGRELEKLEIAKINNLYLTIALDSVTVNDSGARYAITVEQQAAPKAANRGKRTFYVSKGEKKDAFILRDVKGPVDNPTELILELPDSDKPVSIGKEKAFRRVDGYTADLKYPPENRNFPNRRANDPTFGKITVAGEPYNIVAISENEVVLSAANGRKYTKSYNAAP